MVKREEIVNRRVEAYMTPNPYFVRPDEPLARAWDMMLTHDVRHLPVVENERVVGVLSDRDITLAEMLGGDPAKLTAAHVMSRDVYTVEPRANLGVVAGEMARRRVGSAIVVDADKIAGVFTTTDALEALEEAVRVV